MNLTELHQAIAAGESEKVEFKKSTAQLSRAAETLCAFLNGDGGQVIIGVTPEGKILGQQVADKTLQDIAAIIENFEPPAQIKIERVALNAGKEIIVLEVVAANNSVPFTFSGRPYQRVGSTTIQMPQERYQQLLLERVHSRRRWENEPAPSAKWEDLDHEEILRTVRVGVEAGRLPESTGSDILDILGRLGLRDDNRILNAAVVLFGTRFLPEYPQCQLRMARFKGVDKSEFLDQRQLERHTFRLLEEALIFLRRHLPIAGRVLPGLFEREDEPLFPLGALREALVNAFCHRDYTNPGGSVSLAIYDDRLGDLERRHLTVRSPNRRLET